MKGFSLPAFLAAAFTLSVSANAMVHGAHSGGNFYSDKDAFEGAELRGLARLAIGNLYSPCPGPSATPEQRRRFEKLRDESASHAVKIDLEIVHSAYTLQMSVIKLRCRPAKGNEGFFEISRSRVDEYLDWIEREIAERPDYAKETVTGPYTKEDARSGGSVQRAAQLAFAQISDPCGGTSDKLAALAGKYSALKLSSTTHAQRIDFAIGEADDEHSMSLVDIICPEPGSENEQTQLKIREDLAAASIERLENAIASAYPSEE